MQKIECDRCGKQDKAFDASINSDDTRTSGEFNQAWRLLVLSGATNAPGWTYSRVELCAECAEDVLVFLQPFQRNVETGEPYQPDPKAVEVTRKAMDLLKDHLEFPFRKHYSDPNR